MLSNISLLPESVPNHLTHIPQEVVPLLLAKPHLALKAHSQSLLIKIVPEFQPSPVPSKEDQYPLPLMPHNGHHTPVVSSPTVELPSITESYLLDTPPLLG